jgi:transcriptional regulator with XRE-family HTH domain
MSRSKEIVRSATDEPGALLGGAIRARRHGLGLTLVQLAGATGLSHPFLSQVERGHARPSMQSLYRIATALGTSQQMLLAQGSAQMDQPALGAVSVPETAHAVASARLIDGVENGSFVTELVVSHYEFQSFYRHVHREVVYAVSGCIEVELASESAPGELHILRPRESLAYPADTDHRFRCVESEQAVVLLMHL